MLISGHRKQIVVGYPLALNNFKEKVRVGPPTREARAPCFFALEIQVLPEFYSSLSARAKCRQRAGFLEGGRACGDVNI